MRVALAPAWQETTSQLTWWARPGLEVRAGRLTVAGRDAEAIARAHGTPVYVYDLVRIEEQAGASRTPSAAPACAARAARAEGTARARVPRLPPVTRGARARRRASGWMSARRGSPVGARSRLDPRRSATRDEPVRSGPGRGPRGGRAPERGPADPAGPGGRRAPGSTVGVRVNPRIGAAYRVEGRVTRAIGRRSSGSTRIGSRRPSTSPAGTTSRSTPCTSTPATCTDRRPADGRRDDATGRWAPGSCWRPDAPSPRSTPAAVSACRSRRATARSTRGRSPSSTQTSGRSTSPSARSPASSS